MIDSTYSMNILQVTVHANQINWVQNKDTIICCPQDLHFKYKDSKK